MGDYYNPNDDLSMQRGMRAFVSNADDEKRIILQVNYILTKMKSLCTKFIMPPTAQEYLIIFIMTKESLFNFLILEVWLIKD